MSIDSTDSQRFTIAMACFLICALHLGSLNRLFYAQYSPGVNLSDDYAFITIFQVTSYLYHSPELCIRNYSIALNNWINITTWKFLLSCNLELDLEILFPEIARIGSHGRAFHDYT